MRSNKVQFIWRSTSWFNNLWSSAFLSIIAAIIVQVIVELSLGFERANAWTQEYLWYLVGTLLIVFTIVRRPVSNRAGGAGRKDGERKGSL